jgi:hypothetical protein
LTVEKTVTFEAALIALIGVLLIGGVAYWITTPLLRGVSSVPDPDPKAVALLTRREAVLAGLRDLEADHSDGRLSEEDYERLRAELLAEGTQTLEALDALYASSSDWSAALVAEVEAEVRQTNPQVPDS